MTGDASWLVALDDLPIFLSRQPWNADIITEVCRRMNPGEAPGLDTWRAAELQLLLGQVVLWIAELLEAVQCIDRWLYKLFCSEGR